MKERTQITAWFKAEEYDDYFFLDRQFRSIAPEMRKGYPKARVAMSFWKSIILGLRRPDHYPLPEMLYRMCHAVMRPEDQEGHAQIDRLLNGDEEQTTES